MAETLVTFVKDKFPHVAGDVVKVDNDELKVIDSSYYKKGAHDYEPEESTEAKAEREAAEARRKQHEAEAAFKDVVTPPKAATEEELKEAEVKAETPAAPIEQAQEIAHDVEKARVEDVKNNKK